MNKTEKNQTCQRIQYNDKSPTGESRVSTILGLVIEQTKTYVIFKTSRRKYKILRQAIISQENTDIIFEEGLE